MKQIILISFILILCASCKEYVDNEQFCPCSINLNKQGYAAGFPSVTNPDAPVFTISYLNPLMLPFKLKYNAKDGLFIEDDVHEIVTPFGVFGIEYSLPLTGGDRVIDGVIVPKGDYIVAIVDKNKKSKQLFSIKGLNTLRVVLDGGQSVIDFQSGYVEIDVTHTNRKEIQFIDKSQIAIQNDSNKKEIFWIRHNYSWWLCSLNPKETKYYSYAFNQESTVPTTQIQVITQDLRNNRREESTRNATAGDVWVLYWNEKKEALDMKKR